jgi:hypothetical protein
MEAGRRAGGRRRLCGGVREGAVLARWRRRAAARWCSGGGAELWRRWGPDLGLSGPDLDPWAATVASFWRGGPLLVGGSRATGYGAAGACCSGGCAPDRGPSGPDLAWPRRPCPPGAVQSSALRRRPCTPGLAGLPPPFPRVKGGRRSYSGICGVPAFYGVTISVPSWRARYCSGGGHAPPRRHATCCGGSLATVPVSVPPGCGSLPG